MDTYLLVFFRIITIMFLLLFTTLVIMGKRPIGELPVFDFLAIVVMGAVVGADIADPKIKHLPTAFAVVVLALVQRFVSVLMVRSTKIRKLMTFEPTVVIQNGQFIRNNLKKIKYSVDEVLMLLREQEIFNPDDVAFGVIEASGNLSVLKKGEAHNVQRKDLSLQAESMGIFYTVVLEGALQEKNIEKLGLTNQDVINILKEKGYDDHRQIFYGAMDRHGHMSISLNETGGVESIDR